MKPQKAKSNLEHKKEKNNTVAKSQKPVDDENKMPVSSLTWHRHRCMGHWFWPPGFDDRDE